MVNTRRLLVSCAALAATAIVFALGAFLFSLGWNWLHVTQVRPSDLAIFSFLLMVCVVGGIAVARWTLKVNKTAQASGGPQTR